MKVACSPVQREPRIAQREHTLLCQRVTLRPPCSVGDDAGLGEAVLCPTRCLGIDLTLSLKSLIQTPRGASAVSPRVLSRVGDLERIDQ